MPVTSPGQILHPLLHCGLEPLIHYEMKKDEQWQGISPMCCLCRSANLLNKPLYPITAPPTTHCLNLRCVANFSRLSAGVCIAAPEQSSVCLEEGEAEGEGDVEGRARGGRGEGEGRGRRRGDGEGEEKVEGRGESGSLRFAAMSKTHTDGSADFAGFGFATSPGSVVQRLLDGTFKAACVAVARHRCQVAVAGEMLGLELLGGILARGTPEGLPHEPASILNMADCSSVITTFQRHRCGREARTFPYTGGLPRHRDALCERHRQG